MEMPVAVVGWSNQAETFLSLLEHYRRMDMFCDCTIACERQFFRAHKVILSTSSEFFESIFNSTPDKNPVIIMNDIDAWQMECLMDYMYKGETSIPDAYFDSLCRVAKCLQIKGFDKVEIYRKAVKLSKQKDSRLLEKQIKEFNTYSNLNFTLEKVVSQLSNSNISKNNDTNISKNSNTTNNNNNRDSKSSNSVNDVNEDKLPESPSTSSVYEEFNRNERLKSSPVPHNLPPMVSFLRHFRNCDEIDKNKLSDQRKEEDSKVFVCQKEKNSPSFPFQSLYNQKSRFDKGTSSHAKNTSRCSYETVDPEVKNEFSLPSISCKSSLPSDLRSPKARLSFIHPQSPDSKKEESVYSCSDEADSLSSDETRGGKSSPPKVVSPSTLSRNEFIAKLFLNKDISHTSPGPLQTPDAPLHKRKPPPPLLKLCEGTSPFNFMRKDSDFLFSHIKRKSTKAPRPEKISPYIRPNQSSILFNKSFSVPPDSDYRGIMNKPEPTFINLDSKYVSSDGRDSPLNLSGKSTNPFNYEDLPEIRKIQTSVIESRSSTPGGDPLLKKIQTNKRKRVRGPKSWEYLLRLLKDPVSNPSLIKWEDENSAIFRLICPEIIAKRWGKRTGKHTTEILSYESFARGLRYHYATGALNAVSEKSFVYQFGPKAQKALNEYVDEKKEPAPHEESRTDID